jgi:DNA polymerase V
VQTAADLAALDPDNARAPMTVTGGRTVPLHAVKI